MSITKSLTQIFFLFTISFLTYSVAFWISGMSPIAKICLSFGIFFLVVFVTLRFIARRLARK